MNMRKILAAMLAVVMLIAMVPAKAQAAEDDTVYESGKLYLDKTATLEDNGTYTIRLEAFATGTPVTTSVITGTPLDVVLVIDQSGSMHNYGYLDDLENALDAFIQQLVENGKKIGKTHRVAVTGFACAAWELTVTHSVGTANGTPYTTNLPVSNGSYGSLWTNTGIYLNDGTFKNYQEFQFKEIAQSDLPSYNRNTDNFHVTLGNHTYTNKNGTDTVERTFPKYFVDDTETWTYTDENGVEQPQTVRRGIYQHSDGKWYYDFRGYDRLENTVNPVLVNGNGTLGNKVVYEIDYSTYTGSDDLSKMFDGGYLTEEDYQKTFMNVTDGTNGAGNVTQAINSIIDNLGASGATRTGTGMEMAYNILANNPLTEEDKAEGRERVVIVFTDGIPGQSSFEIDEANKALEYGAQIKDLTGTEKNVDIYSIGLFDDKVFVNETSVEEGRRLANVLMNGLSSNYPDADSMDDVWETVTEQDYAPAGSISLSNYRDNRNTWQTMNGYYALVNGVYEPIEVYVSRSGFISYNYTWQFRSKTTQTTLEASVSNKNYSSASATIQNAYVLTETITEGYSSTGTPDVEGGKYYREAENVEDLADMFPTIVTESTSTSMDSVYLTEGSILRDIMGAGFLLTGETTISTFTETGTWTSTNDTHTEGTIAWSGTEVPGPYLHVEDPKTLTKPDVTDPIQIYNTNPGPNNDNVGGNFYETADGTLNLSAPPTIDITGFDYEEEYLAFNKEGKRLIVTITGVEAQPDKVGYDKNNLTNHMQSGLWSPMKEDRTRELVGNFPMPNTTFTDALYVLDYAKPMNIPLSDLKMFKADSLDEDAMNYFNPAVPEITEANGKVVLENGKLVYKPMTTAWDGYDTFYVFGESELSTITDYSSNRNGNLWSRVKVLPANNVYYEDTFIQAEGGVTVGIVYDGKWDYVTETDPDSSAPDTNKENPESGETNNGADQPFGGVHGWEDYLADDETFSDGGAHKSELTNTGDTATATFTFTGTGVDIYSYTDLVQGAVLASIYRGDHVPTTEEMQQDPAKRPLYSCIMDNFSLSDGYYQIPTLSLHEKNVQKTDESGNKFTAQEPLEHDTYTVKLTVMAKIDNADNDDTTVDEGRKDGQTRRYTYHLDGIRIYNPIQNLEGDETVRKAYGEEELNASFVEVRDILLDAKSFDVDAGDIDGDGVSDTLGYGVVFLDQIPADDPENGSGNPDDQAGKETDKIGLYECYGPKNEVYLAGGQSIAFIPKAGYRYYVGLKSPTGETVCVSILKDGESKLLTITHTTDLYYEITPEDGIVLIENAGFDEDFNEYDNLLSVTKIKVTGPDGNEVAPADFFEPVDQPTVLRMVRTLRQEAAAEPEIPEDTEPTEPTGPEVDIENPTEPSEPEVPVEDDKNHYDDLWKLIGGIFDLIRGIIIN